MAAARNSRHLLLAVLTAVAAAGLAAAPTQGAQGPKPTTVEAAGFGLSVDFSGREFFKEPAPTATGEVLPPPTAAVVDDVFALHSRPTSQNIIFLDFDGYTWPAGSWWEGAWGLSLAGTTSPGYNPEGEWTTFTANERAYIQQIWEAVSEDFAVFDVDVTTEEPTGERAAAFQQRGAHALILSDTTLQGACGCGGIAYVDVFEYDDPQLHPSLNFTLYGGWTPPPWDAAEVVSHEVGHNLGLLHDGTSSVEYYGGQAMWTPIMGAGRGAGIATWSAGGYPDAVTRGSQAFVDDFATIARYLPMLPDLEGSTAGAATAIPISGDVNTFQARIETDSDQDWFSFNVGAGRVGEWTIELRSRGYAPNLDPELTLYDSSLNVLTTSNPLVATEYQYGVITLGLDAEIVRNLTAGTYYLKVVGVGQGSLSGGTGYSNYASRGNYSLVLTPAPITLAVDSFAPAGGGRGTAVLLTGSKFAGATSVKLGTTAVAFTVLSDTQIVAAVPNGATTGGWTVTTAGGSVTSLSQFTVNRSAAPRSISTLAPSVTTPGSDVTVTGVNLGAATSVTVSGLAVPFRVTATNQLVLTLPIDAIDGRVAVTTAGGTATSRGMIYLPPRPASLSPAAGGPGTLLSFTGANLAGVTQVSFGPVTAAPASRSTSSLTVTVPVGAASGPVWLVSPGGTSDTFAFTRLPAPTIDNFTLTVKVGDTVTLTGTNLAGTSAVRVGTTAAAQDSISASDTTVTFTVPAGAVSGRVTVTAPGGVVTSTSTLNVLPSPVITRVSPARGAVGSAVTITGRNLLNATVTVGGITAVKNSNNATTIRITIPAGLSAGVHQIRVTTANGYAVINFTVT